MIENTILEYLWFRGIFCWKNQSVGIFDTKIGKYRKPKSKFHINGVSDIIGIFEGKPLFIEVKTPKTKNNASEDQKKFIKKAKEAGAIAFIAYSIDCVDRELFQLKMNETRAELVDKSKA